MTGRPRRGWLGLECFGVFARTELELGSNGKTGHRLRRNVTIAGRRTSVSLEGHVWEGLSDICRREAVGIDALCAEVDRHRVRSSMSSALRVYLLLYFRGVAERFAGEAVTDPKPDGFLRAALDRFRAGEAE